MCEENHDCGLEMCGGSGVPLFDASVSPLGTIHKLSVRKGSICDDPCSRGACRKCVNTPESNMTPYHLGVKTVKDDPVNHPAHYQVGGIETIDFIEAKGLGLHEGSIVQYITRWRHKGGVEDLKKARWYIDRLISLTERGPAK